MRLRQMASDTWMCYSICQVWKKQIFRMSESCREYLESLIPRIISTENSLMRSTCIPAVSEHHWNCIQTFPKCRKKNSKQHLKSKERHYIRSCQSYSGWWRRSWHVRNWEIPRESERFLRCRSQDFLWNSSHPDIQQQCFVRCLMHLRHLS